jgi:hypothetical protein
MMTKERDWTNECISSQQTSASPRVLAKALDLYDCAQQRRSVYKPYFGLARFFVMIAMRTVMVVYEWLDELLSLFGFLPRNRKSRESLQGLVTAAVLVLSLTYVSIDS